MNQYTQIQLSIQELLSTPIEVIADESGEWENWREDLEWLYNFRKENIYSKEIDPDIPIEVLKWAEDYLVEFYFTEWDDRGEWDNNKLSRWRTFYRINDYLNLISISTMV